QGDLERARRRPAQIFELLERAEPGGRRDALDRLVEHVAVVGEDADLPPRLDRLEPVEVLEDRDDEALAPHLAVGDHVDTGPLLIPHRGGDRGGLRLPDLPPAAAPPPPPLPPR